MAGWQFGRVVPKMAANFLPFDPNTRVNLSFPVLGFTVALVDFDRAADGIYPALQSSHADLVDGLKGRRPRGERQREQQRFRKILVGAQVALSVTLLAGAALLIASFVRLNQQNRRLPATEMFGSVSSLCRRHSILIRDASAFRRTIARLVASGSRF